MEKKKKGAGLPWKITAVVLAVALVAVSCTWLFTAKNRNSKQKSAESSAAETTNKVTAPANGDSLSLWTEKAPLKSQMTEYMKAITDKNSKDFIPVEDRIAVFDMDGTLCCETDPGYFDHKICITA
ncbi:MAG: hypothetical protein IJT85_08610 [Ruminococcus sp.]|nr:hypothetical protein [Ruminococcus sp.]